MPLYAQVEVGRGGHRVMDVLYYSTAPSPGLLAAIAALGRVLVALTNDAEAQLLVTQSPAFRGHQRPDGSWKLERRPVDDPTPPTRR